MRILRRAGVDLILYMLKNFTTLELREDDVLTTAGFWSMIVGGLELLMLENWDCEIHLTCLDDGASEDSPFSPDTTRSLGMDRFTLNRFLPIPISTDFENFNLTDTDNEN